MEKAFYEKHTINRNKQIYWENEWGEKHHENSKHNSAGVAVSVSDGANIKV